MAQATVRVGAFFLTNQADGTAAQAAKSADDGLVLGELPIASQRREILN